MATKEYSFYPGCSSERNASASNYMISVESACDHSADMIVTPCPVCQMNVEVYQDQINQTYGTKFNMPVVYYSQLMSVAYGGSIKDAGLNGQVIRAKKLEETASK